LSGNS